MPEGKNYYQNIEVAALMQVAPRTISRWAREGRLAYTVTLGGHRRYDRRYIDAMGERIKDAEELVWMES